MKKIVPIILILGGFLCTAAVSAQDYVSPQVAVSSEKAAVGGNIYYVHKVLAKQTLYSISKAYDVTIDQLNQANPSLLEDGLKEGSVILIPTGEKAAVPDRSVQSDENQEDEAQTDWKGDEVVNHRVKWYESLKAIANRYGVSEEAILEYNNITEIRKGMQLQIPMRLYKEEDYLNPETGQEHPVQENISVISAKKYFTSDDPLRIALILPFEASTNTPSNNCFDFYCGALMALEEARVQGRNIELEVFDLNAIPDRNAIVKSVKFKSCDIIIGPIDSKDIELFAETAAELNIPFVSPMDQKADALIEGNEWFFQVPTSVEVQRRNLIKSLNCGSGDKVLFVYNSSMAEAAYVEELKSLLSEERIEFREVSYNILNGRDIVESLRASMSINTNWKVVVASEQEAFASDVIRNMSVLSLYGVPVEVYCSNRVRNFETIDSEALFDSKAHVSAPYFIDYNESSIKCFLLSYRALFNTEPTPYAFQGHDIFACFIDKMFTTGNVMDQDSWNGMTELLQCNIRFEQVSPGSGWHNAATRDFFYDSEKEQIILSGVKDRD